MGSLTCEGIDDSHEIDTFANVLDVLSYIMFCIILI